MPLSAGSRDEIFEGVEAEPVDAFATGGNVVTCSVICVWGRAITCIRNGGAQHLKNWLNITYEAGQDLPRLRPMISWRAPRWPTIRRCSHFPRGPAAVDSRRIGCAATPIDNLSSRSFGFHCHSAEEKNLACLS